MTGKIEIIAEHSVKLPTNSGFVLDVGCRSFSFSKEMVRRGYSVIALDPDPTIEDPKISGISYERVALTAKGGKAKFEMASDPQARRLSDAGTVEVDCVTIQDIMRLNWISVFRIVKLDCEGAEYEILENWPGPIAEQVTVEFHEHVSPQPPERYEKILARMGNWYNLVQHEKTERHCLKPANYWDSLWIKR